MPGPRVIHIRQVQYRKNFGQWKRDQDRTARVLGEIDPTSKEAIGFRIRYATAKRNIHQGLLYDLRDEEEDEFRRISEDWKNSEQFKTFLDSLHPVDVQTVCPPPEILFVNAESRKVTLAAYKSLFATDLSPDGIKYNSDQDTMYLRWDTFDIDLLLRNPLSFHNHISNAKYQDSENIHNFAFLLDHTAPEWESWLGYHQHENLQAIPPNYGPFMCWIDHIMQRFIMKNRNGVFSGGAKNVSVVLKDYSNTDAIEEQADLYLHSPINFERTCKLYESFAPTHGSDEFFRMPDSPLLAIPPELAAYVAEGGIDLISWDNLEKFEFKIVLTGKQRMHLESLYQSCKRRAVKHNTEVSRRLTELFDALPFGHED